MPWSAAGPLAGLLGRANIRLVIDAAEKSGANRAALLSQAHFDTTGELR